MDWAGFRGNLQLKTTHLSQRSKWDETMPYNYRLQVEAEMYAMDVKWGSIAVLIGGSDFRWMDYEANPEMLADMLPRLQAFWQNIVDGGKPPDATSDDLEAVKAMYPQSDPEKILEVGAEDAIEFRLQWGMRQEAAEIKRDAQAAYDGATTRLRSMIGENEEAILPDGAKFRLPTYEMGELTTTRKAYKCRKLFFKEAE